METSGSFLEINVVRYKGFRVSVKFMDDRGEIKYIERFLPEFELERVFSKDIAITMFMDSIVSYVINEYGRIHPEGIYVRQIINEPIKPEDMSSDILKFFIK